MSPSGSRYRCSTEQRNDESLLLRNGADVEKKSTRGPSSLQFHQVGEEDEEGGGVVWSARGATNMAANDLQGFDGRLLLGRGGVHAWRSMSRAVSSPADPSSDETPDDGCSVQPAQKG